MLQLIPGLVGQILFVGMLAGTVQIIDSSCCGKMSRSFRLAAAGVTFSWLLSVIYSLLIPFGLFRPLPAILLATAVFMLSRRLAGRAADPVENNDSWRNLISELVNHNAALRLTSIIFVFFLILHLLRVLALPLLSWDTLTYHGLKAGSWVQTGGWLLLDAPGAWESYRSFLGGGEVFTAWAMLFLRSDALAGVPDIFFWLYLVVICSSLAVQAGLRRSSSLAVAAAIACSFEFSGLVGSGYVDTAATVFLLASVFFAGQYLRNDDFISASLAFAAAGLASSVKVNAMAAAIVTMAVFVIMVIKRHGCELRRWLVWSLLFAAPVVQWLAFNYYITGFPLGCAPAKIGALVLGALPPNLEWFFDRPDLSPYNLVVEIRSLLQAVYCYGFALLFIVLSIPGAMREIRRNPGENLLKCLMVFVVFALYFSPSFSVIRLGWPTLNGRFIAPAMLLLAVFALHGLQKFRYGNTFLESVAAITCLHGGYNFLFVYYFDRDAVELYMLWISAFLTLCLVVAQHRAFASLREKLVRRSFALLLLAMVLIPATAGHFKNSFRSAYLHCWTLHAFKKDWVPGLIRILQENEPLHIAFAYGPEKIGHQVFIAPYLGTGLQNQISYITPEKEGKIIYYHPEHLKRSQPDYQSWKKRLEQAGVTHLVTFLPPAVELKWAEENPDSFARLEGDGKTWGVFRFIPDQQRIPAADRQGL